MRVRVIIPVGPEHHEVSCRAADSVRKAWARDRGPFKELEIAKVVGARRSRARNIGMDGEADWFFLLDADDTMVPEAFGRVRLDHPATFGAVYLRRGQMAHVSPQNVWPLDRVGLFKHKSRGTLSMGCFVRGDVETRFDESLDNGEDFDFYARLPGWVKIDRPLVEISYRPGQEARAAGWAQACADVLRKYEAS